ncbi:protein kinase, putative [Bodo saltans]|uniref:Protein kinase, putative n=1 Tax=Bodo saltans TaxID=75058 RepID=A0A0S4JF22_BODSA|nr:protein kinase, putative [Bodo saltans]|eukprot:CUG86995.1 protein kinase, putative [Bodo saltans]
MRPKQRTIQKTDPIKCHFPRSVYFLLDFHLIHANLAFFVSSLVNTMKFQRMDRGAKTGLVEPSRVGAYIISHKIGAGQFAKVYLGHHHKEGYAVAVKAIDRRRSPESNVHSEVRELVRLQGHPNIVRLYDTFENSTYMCAVLEFCAGGDLKQCVDTLASERKLQSGEEKTGSSSNSAKVERRDVPTATATPPVIDEFTVRRLASQLISSMSYLSSMNVIHRDLKPENLLLTDKDVRKADLRIADLGFARAVHSQQMMTSYLGTAYYMAPERLRGDKYDFQAEVWATGLIMYEMVYGEHPFPANGVFDLSNKIHTKVLQFPRLDPEPSDALKDLLQRMIVEDPAKRITIDAAKEHETKR